MSIPMRNSLGHPVSPLWSDENIATLRRMHAAGKSASQIGIALGCTRNSAIGKLHRLRLKDNDRPIHLRNRVELGQPMRIPYTGKRHNNPLGFNHKKRRPASKVSRPPRAAPVTPVIVPVLGPVLNLHRPSDRCSFIADNPRLVPAAELLACGETVVRGSSFCPEHHARCFSHHQVSVRSATYVQQGRAA